MEEEDENFLSGAYDHLYFTDNDDLPDSDVGTKEVCQIMLDENDDSCFSGKYELYCDIKFRCIKTFY